MVLELASLGVTGLMVGVALLLCYMGVRLERAGHEVPVLLHLQGSRFLLFYTVTVLWFPWFTASRLGGRGARRLLQFWNCRGRGRLGFGASMGSGFPFPVDVRP